ncbi:MAG TPA: SUMF1/EgtB/PvdO family nonheme iron enzyme, partial [Kofleriaceae bacterium]
MRFLGVFLFVVACGEVKAKQPDGGGGGDDAAGNVDALTALTISASPSSFNLHANDTRDTKITITNTSGQTSGMPTLQVSGLTLGSMTFPSQTNTCPSSLAPGSSCTVIGHLIATAAGQVDFQLTATASTAGTGMATLTMTATAACPANCGPAGNANCCESSVVPGNAVGATLAGGLFYRTYDMGSDNRFTFNATTAATVSDFRLDTYEITVGRFRAFVDAGKGTQGSPPAAGAGAHSKIAGSGWDVSWNGSLAADSTALKTALKCDATRQSWTDTAGANEALPINCINWYDAMAFCSWDGGFLPTEAEWNYAASGGAEQRAYPWSNPATSLTIDCSYANFHPSTYCVNDPTGGTNRVGSESPKGDGKWGHSDLAGNVWEWTLDAFG